jgi:tRNA nucleotidyltransferase (CCA-adding enzyme)
LIDIKGALRALANAFDTYCKANNTNATLYAVGGFVRNAMLHLPLSDIDICSSLTPTEIIEFCNKQGYKYVPKGIAFGMVEIHFPYQSSVLFLEHTTFRSDKYADNGSHRPQSVVFANSLEKDAFRRDFTVNALYENLLTGEIIDPTGGVADLKNKLIRATSKDPSEIMRDDGLRIMRMVRFAAELCFEIEENTYNAAVQNVNGLKNISAERIRDELNKILLSDIKYPSLVDEWKLQHEKDDSHRLKSHENSPVLRSLLTLRDMGVLALILPELEDCRDYAQKRKYHIYDVLEHLFHVCAETPPVLYMRLAGLFHDVGKPISHKQNKGKNMHGHDAVGAILAQDALKRLCYSNEIIQKVVKLISVHMYDIAGTAKDNTLKARFASWGEPLILDLIEFRRADIRGSGNPSREVDSAERFCEVYMQMRASGAPFSMSDLAVNGTDILRALRVKPSAIIGRVKYELLRHCASNPQDNNYMKLIELSNEIYKRIIKQKDK